MSDPEHMELRRIVPTGPRVKPTCPHCKVLLVGDECPNCDYVRVKGYDIEPDTNMTGHGFRKELDWRQIFKDPKGKWHIITYYFRASDFTCSSCNTSDYTWLSPQRTGIYKTCLGCNRTTGPLSLEFGEQVKDEVVEPEAIMELYKARKLKPPATLQEEIMARRSTIRKRKMRGRHKSVETF